MSYILTIHNKSLFEYLLSKTHDTKKPYEYKQFIYKYDDYIGIYNQSSNTYNTIQSEQIDSNSHFVFEKYKSINHLYPPISIDDLYYENVVQHEDYKIIGNKDNFIIQFEFNDYKKFVYLLQTKYKSLFEKLDLISLSSYFETYIETYIDKKPSIVKPIEHSTKIEYTKIKNSFRSHDSKPSKYQNKNTSKYEPKRYSGGVYDGRTDSYKKSDRRFDSKISFVSSDRV